MSFKIVRAFSFSLLITAKSLIQSLMKSSGRVTSISMAIKGEADIRQEDSMRGSLQTSCTQAVIRTTIFVPIYHFCSLRNAKLFVSLLTFLVEGSYKTKAVWIQFQLQYPDTWLTTSWVFTMLGAQQWAAEGTGQSTLNYSKCLLISSC